MPNLGESLPCSPGQGAIQPPIERAQPPPRPSGRGVRGSWQPLNRRHPPAHWGCSNTCCGLARPAPGVIDSPAALGLSGRPSSKVPWVNQQGWHGRWPQHVGELLLQNWGRR